jgi:hypothetical protein
MSQRVAKAVEARRAAEALVANALKEDYPPGAPITWKANNGHWQSGVVAMNCYGDRIKVQNHKTGRECFIDATRIYAAGALEDR